MWSEAIWKMIGVGILETLYMTLASTAVAYLLGVPLGVLLVVSEPEGIRPTPWWNGFFNLTINILRSVPFLILLILVLPITRAITGTTIGATATVVPLVIAAFPFVARLVESSLKEVDKGMIEAALSMGASPFKIILKVLIPEAAPSLVVGCAIATTTILGYSAMAGIVGGGGLGAIAIRYGYNRYQTDIMLITVALLVIIVQVMQEVGTKIALKRDKRRQ